MSLLSKLSMLLSGLALTAVAPALVFGQTQIASIGDVVTRMEQAHAKSRDANVAYTVTREYQLAGVNDGASKPTSQVVANINFLSPSQEEYSILKTAGSDRGEKIVRKVLDHETEMAGHHESVEVSARNYNFALLGSDMVDGHTCYRLSLEPKRDAAELLRGTAWVDADSFVIRRIEGTPAKSPSFWVKNLHITINFGDVQGVWLQTSTKAVADIRMAGTHVLTSRATDLRTASLSAQNGAPSRRSKSPRGLANSAVWVTR